VRRREDEKTRRQEDEAFANAAEQDQEKLCGFEVSKVDAVGGGKEHSRLSIPAHPDTPPKWLLFVGHGAICVLAPPARLQFRGSRASSQSDNFLLSLNLWCCVLPAISAWYTKYTNGIERRLAERQP